MQVIFLDCDGVINIFSPSYRTGTIQKDDSYDYFEEHDYLLDHPEITGYVILEDEPEDICGNKCSVIDSKFVVDVNYEIGLTHLDIVKAQNILYDQESL